MTATSDHTLSKIHIVVNDWNVALTWTNGVQPLEAFAEPKDH